MLGPGTNNSFCTKLGQDQGRGQGENQGGSLGQREVLGVFIVFKLLVQDPRIPAFSRSQILIYFFCNLTHFITDGFLLVLRCSSIVKVLMEIIMGCTVNQKNIFSSSKQVHLWRWVWSLFALNLSMQDLFSVLFDQDIY